MKRSPIICAGSADAAATADLSRQIEDRAPERAERILEASGESDQLALAKRLDVLCKPLGSRNAAVDAEFDETVGDGLKANL